MMTRRNLCRQYAGTREDEEQRKSQLLQEWTRSNGAIRICEKEEGFIETNTSTSIDKKNQSIGQVTLQTTDLRLFVSSNLAVSPNT